MHGARHRDRLRAYAPRGLLSADGAAPVLAHRVGSGAVLVADLCGFTRLTEQLEGMGRAGADELTELLDGTFGPFVDRICESGGDVVAFAGDSVLAAWESGGDVSPGQAEEAAVHCALSGLERHAARSTTARRYLPVRIAIGTGEIQRFELGGLSGRWMHMLAGEAVQEALRGDLLRLRDRVVLPAPLARRLQPGIAGEWLDEVHFAAEGWTLRDIHAVGQPPAQLGEGVMVECFVAEPVIERLAAGTSQFMAEFRHATAMFLGLDPALTLDLQRLQSVVQGVQRQLERFEGTLHQVITDDKGLSIVGAFGLPPRSHDDDPERAVECAQRLLEDLAGLAVSARAAVSSGLVYCGDYGGARRRQYGVVGQTMNRAAHLLSEAAAGTVVCDENTRKRAARRRQFVDLPDLPSPKVSGTFRRYAATPTAPTQRPPAPPSEVVGRAALLDRLGNYLASLFEDGVTPPMLVLEADAGMGKTTLLSDLHRRARHAGVQAAWSQGELGQPSMLAPLRPLLGALRQLAPAFEGGLEASRAAVLHLVQPEQYASDPRLERLSPQLRMERLVDLVRGWCAEATRQRPLLWLIEDAHWIDSATQSVIAELVGSIARFGAVLAQRSFPRVAVGTRQAPREVLRLDPMSREDTRRLLGRRLGVEELPELLLDRIHERVGGNPLFAEEMAEMLLERGDVRVAEGVCKVDASLRKVQNAAIPPSLESVITTRIDRLDPADQITLKAASVLGRAVAPALLLQVRPEAEAAALSAQLSRIAAAGFLAEDAGEGFVFRHSLYQEVTYGALVRSQRQELHRRAAVALQGGRDEPFERDLARVAVHWEQAGELARALPLLERAADQALRAYANAESIELHERALSAREQIQGVPHVDATVARMQHNIGMAHANLARHDLARTHFARSLRACNLHNPDGRSWRFVAVLGTQLWHRVRRALTGRGAAPLDGEARELAELAMYTLGDLSAANLWLGDHAGYAHSTLLLSNVGDALEPSALSVGATSGLGYLLGMTPLRGVGEADLRRAVAGIDVIDDPMIETICQVMLGMFLTATGRARAAIEVLRAASLCGARLDGGPWRHRSRFMLAEALLMAGRPRDAQRRFDEAAELARLGEPQVVGFAKALGALASLQLGDTGAAIASLLGDEGVEDTRGNDARLPLFASLGALAEVSTLAQLEPDRGAAAAREAESLAGDWDDTATYFAGYFGHAGVMEWWLDALERGVPAAAWHVDQGLRRMARFCARYPGARSRLLLFRARRAWTQDKHRRAQRLLARAAVMARELGLERECREAEQRAAASAAGSMPLAHELHASRAAAEVEGKESSHAA